MRGGSSNSGSAPFFLAWLDRDGVAQVYRFSAVERLGRRPIPGEPGWFAPDSLRILYGGSVKVDNVVALLAAPGVDGVLVGGASLDPDGWAEIVGIG